MQLSEATEIMEVSGVEKVNAALQNGWKIIATNAVTSRRLGEHAFVVVCYTLGRTAPTSQGNTNDQ